MTKPNETYEEKKKRMEDERRKANEKVKRSHGLGKK